jgi:AAA15 family ATPase/GTPase
MEKEPTSSKTRLKRISYHEYEEDPSRAWSVDDFELEKINLLVGLNSAGKSRMLRLINSLARCIDGSTPVSNMETGHYIATFESPTSRGDITYEFAITSRKITLERLSIDGKTFLKRIKGTTAHLFFEKVNEELEVQIPPNLLAANSRRDSGQHKFFEPLHQWAETIRYCEFSKFDSSHSIATEGRIDPEALNAMPSFLAWLLYFKLGNEKYPHRFTASITTDLNRIGYQVESIKFKPQSGVHMPQMVNKDTHTVFVKEKGINIELPIAQLSSGMVRAIGLLTIFHYSKFQKNRDTLLIDDIGEGLDFDRSKKIIEILMEEAEKGFMQLIMTSNDRFVMNTMPIQWWSVIQREGNKINIYNNQNSRDAFEEFEEWGFNNFDFLSKKLYKK